MIRTKQGVEGVEGVDAVDGVDEADGNDGVENLNTATEKQIWRNKTATPNA